MNARRNQSDKRVLFRRQERVVEQTVGGIDLQIVTCIEHVHDNRQFNAAGLQAQVEIAERNRMRRRRRGVGEECGDRRREHESLHGPERQW